MEHKKSLVIGGLFLILIIIYFSYQTFLLIYYNINYVQGIDYNSFIKGLKITDKMTIKTEYLDNEDYLEFADLKVKNEFKNFQLLEQQATDDSIKYVLRDDKNDVVASFWISKGYSYVDMLKSDMIFFGNDEKGKRISNTNLTKILDKNKITNDIELFKFLGANKEVKNNIFTPRKKMQENFTIKYIVSVILPKLNNITLIDGDLEGYILDIKASSNNLKNVKEAAIKCGNQVYFLTFINGNEKYFTNQDINDILNTITEKNN